MDIHPKLRELGLKLPTAQSPIAAYVPAAAAHGLLHISGQLPFTADGELLVGRLDSERDIAAGQEAARRCALMLLAQIDQALGSEFDRIERVVKLGVFVASGPEFIHQAKVANGASELLAHVFGDKGRHARSAVGVAALPLGVSVEIDAVLSLHSVAADRAA